MAGSREHRTYVATTARGGGKSYTTLWEQIIPYVMGLLNGGKKRKGLIFDTQNEYKFIEGDTESNLYPQTEKHKRLSGGKPIRIAPIDWRDVGEFAKQKKPELRYIPTIHSQDVYDKKGVLIARQGSKMTPEEAVEALKFVLNNYKNGLLLIEDLRVLFNNSIPHNIIALILSTRHRKIDLIWHLQSLGRLLPEYWENIDAVRFHGEDNGIDVHSDKLEAKYEAFKIAEILVNKFKAAGNDFFYIWYIAKTKKLIGAYTKEQLMWCIRKYIMITRASIDEYKRELNDSGKPRYTYSQCVEMKAKELFIKYYGNSN